MRSTLTLTLLLILATSVAAEDYVLPVVAVNMSAGDGTAWSSEVYATNPGDKEVTVTVGVFLPGRVSDTPPCLPIVPPFFKVPPHSSILWSTPNLAGGVGCPDFAVGGLMLHTDLPVHISSRMTRHQEVKGYPESPLSGIGQEIDAVALLDLPKGESRMILPTVGWHPNACGPSRLDTNVFFTNPMPTPVRIAIDALPGEQELRVDGELVPAPYELEVAPLAQRVIRLAGPGSPMLPVCLEPVTGAFTFTTSGSIIALASIIDRGSGDPRTVPALPVE